MGVCTMCGRVLTGMDEKMLLMGREHTVCSRCAIMVDESNESG